MFCSRGSALRSPQNACFHSAVIMVSAVQSTRSINGSSSANQASPARTPLGNRSNTSKPTTTTPGSTGKSGSQPSSHAKPAGRDSAIDVSTAKAVSATLGSDHCPPLPPAASRGIPLPDPLNVRSVVDSGAAAAAGSTTQPSQHA